MEWIPIRKKILSNLPYMSLDNYSKTSKRFQLTADLVEKMFVQKKGSFTGKSLWGFNLRFSLVNRNVQKNYLYTDINWNLRQNAIISNTFWSSERFMNPPSPMPFHLSIYDKESCFQYWRHKECQIGHIFS